MILTVASTLDWLTQFNDDIQDNKAYLSELDTPIGDGDHGANMSRGMKEVMLSFEGSIFQSPSDVLKKVAMVLMSKVGGASGPLYGSAFLAMSQVADTANTKAELVSAGLSAIQKRGKAEVGDKTMVDIWSKVLSDLENGNASQERVEKIVIESQDLVAKKGRASYLGERSLGHIDPGTRSSGYLLAALIAVV